MKFLGITPSELESKEVNLILAYAIFSIVSAVCIYMLTLQLFSSIAVHPVNAIINFSSEFKKPPMKQYAKGPLREISVGDQEKGVDFMIGNYQSLKQLSLEYKNTRLIKLDSLFSFVLVGILGGIFVFLGFWGIMLKNLLPHLASIDK